MRFLLLWMIYLTNMGEVAQNGPWISLTEGTAGATTARAEPFAVIPNPAALSADVGEESAFPESAVRSALANSGALHHGSWPHQRVENGRLDPPRAFDLHENTVKAGLGKAVRDGNLGRDLFVRHLRHGHRGKRAASQATRQARLRQLKRSHWH